MSCERLVIVNAAVVVVVAWWWMVTKRGGEMAVAQRPRSAVGLFGEEIVI